MTAPGRPSAQDTSASPSAARSTLGASRDRTGQPFCSVYHRADAVSSSEYVPGPRMTAWGEPCVTVTWALA